MLSMYGMLKYHKQISLLHEANKALEKVRVEEQEWFDKYSEEYTHVLYERAIKAKIWLESYDMANVKNIKNSTARLSATYDLLPDYKQKSLFNAVNSALASQAREALAVIRDYEASFKQRRDLKEDAKVAKAFISQYVRLFKD